MTYHYYTVQHKKNQQITSFGTKITYFLYFILFFSAPEKKNTEICGINIKIYVKSLIPMNKKENYLQLKSSFLESDTTD